MKLIFWLAAAAPFAALIVGARQPEEPWAVLVGGDTGGYLSPCGCTKPMSGGVRRRVAAVRALSLPGRTVVLENGGLVSGTTRQDELKAEALAEALKRMNVDAIALGPEEVRLGEGMVEAIDRLSGGKLVSLSHKQAKPFVVAGPFVVTSVCAESEPPTWDDLPTDRPWVVLLRGDLAAARDLARAQPRAKLVVYSSKSAAATEPIPEGDAWLVSPGEKGKSMLRLGWQAGRWTTLHAVDLGPDFSDDPEAARVYARYLARVDEEDLLEQMPRPSTEAFAGTAACASCHTHADEVWKSSEHSHALHTLEVDGHDRDPDCVGCHVVGLDSVNGFISRASTPKLADVGCESCHGSGVRHISDPYRIKPAGNPKRACLNCHNPDHSPNFDFRTYWQRIRH